MDNAKNQLVEKLKASTNILVTVSRSPSVDQLAACVGLTLLLNKMGKHATAVFSGTVPSTMEFLQPEETIEKTTDSLRDFIIALDKSKADKLRYKVEDEMVRIFITPYRTSLSDQDLEFSQGDFNVDVVVALGVLQQEDFDEAITAHGRILHDAVINSITTGPATELGAVNWSVPQASSLSELIVDLSHDLGTDLLDTQIATALLTGIVSETARFSNEKTTPQTMSISAQLMAAGANQQLVATQLDEGSPAQDSNFTPPSDTQPRSGGLDTSGEPEASEKSEDEPGTLEIAHQDSDKPSGDSGEEASEKLGDAEATPDDKPETLDGEAVPKTPKRMEEPPSRGGTLTANSTPEGLDPAIDPLSPADHDQERILSRSDLEPELTPESAPEPPTPMFSEPNATPSPGIMPPGFTPPPPAWVPPTPVPPETPVPAASDSRALSEIESSVQAADTTTQASESDLDQARDEVNRALNSEPAPPPPVQALGAQPLGDPLRPVETPIPAAQPSAAFTDALHQAIPPTPPTPPAAPVLDTVPSPLPADIPPELANIPGLTFSDPPPTPPTPPAASGQPAPPEVPPPIPFNFGSTPPPPAQ